MLGLSIRQPWARAILYHGKNIENRTWHTKYRGLILLHASKNICGQDDFDFVETTSKMPLPPRTEIQTGGIVGVATLVDCVTESDSPWFFGPYGFVLEQVKPVQFIPLRGRQLLFETGIQPDQIEILKEAA